MSVYFEISIKVCIGMASRHMKARKRPFDKDSVFVFVSSSYFPVSEALPKDERNSVRTWTTDLFLALFGSLFHAVPTAHLVSYRA